jgi:hypothetical protein
MDLDSELWKQLDPEVLPPSGVDIDKAVRVGRRRRRVRVVAGFGGAAAGATAVLMAVPLAIGALHPHGSPLRVAVGSPSVPVPTGTSPTGTRGSTAVTPIGPKAGPAAALPSQCTISRLPAPTGVTMALAFAGDPSGHYLVGRSYQFGTNGSIHEVPAIWHDGMLTSVPMNGADPQFWAINTAGDAVGSTFNGANQTAWAWHGGKLTRLAGGNAIARGINDKGMIVGQNDGRPVVWQSAGAQPTPLLKATGEAYGIANDGTMVGESGDGRALLWYPDASVHYLDLPTGYHSARAVGVHGGWVSGIAFGGPDAGAGAAVRWNLSTGEVLAVPALTLGSSGPVNADGWMGGSDASGYPALSSAGAVLRLPALTDPVQSLDNIVNAISDDGHTIGGQAVLGDKNRTIVAVSWHCS